MFPDLVRRFVRSGARFLVNASNEAWFAGSTMPDQMLAMSVFRAVENRTTVARSANLGISAIIDPYGRVTRRFTGSSPDGVPSEGFSPATFPSAESGTLYTQHGDVFAFACIVPSLIILAGMWFPSRVRRLPAGGGTGRAQGLAGVPSAVSK